MYPMTMRLGYAAALARAAARAAEASISPGERQEHLAGLGELTASRRAVQQARAHLPFQPVDLPTQGRLGQVQGVRGAPEVPMPGEDDEAPHQPQVEIRGG